MTSPRGRIIQIIIDGTAYEVIRDTAEKIFYKGLDGLVKFAEKAHERYEVRYEEDIQEPINPSDDQEPAEPPIDRPEPPEPPEPPETGPGGLLGRI